MGLLGVDKAVSLYLSLLDRCSNKVKAKTVIYICLVMLFLVCVYPCIMTNSDIINYLNACIDSFEGVYSNRLLFVYYVFYLWLCSGTHSVLLSFPLFYADSSRS